MEISNKVILTTLDKIRFGSDILVGLEVLRTRSEAILQNGYFTIRKIAGEPLSVNEYEIETKLSGIQGPIYLGEGESVSIPLEGKLVFRKFRTEYAKKYSYANGSFKLLIPEGKNLINIVQDCHDVSFIQWSLSGHNEKERKIIENAEYALFQNVNYQVFPIAAIMHNSNILFMGQNLIGSKGTYREKI